MRRCSSCSAVFARPSASCPACDAPEPAVGWAQAVDLNEISEAHLLDPLVTAALANDVFDEIDRHRLRSHLSETHPPDVAFEIHWSPAAPEDRLPLGTKMSLLAPLFRTAEAARGRLLRGIWTTEGGARALAVTAPAQTWQNILEARRKGRDELSAEWSSHLGALSDVAQQIADVSAGQKEKVDAHSLALDLSPKAIFLDHEGRASVAPGAFHIETEEGSFGLLAFCLGTMSSESAGTSTPDSATSHRWQSPEAQDGGDDIFGIPSAVEASAVYSLGLIAYTTLVGRHPFHGLGLRDRLNRQANGDVRPFPETIAKGLPPGLQSTVLRMLSGDAEARPSAAHVASVFSDFASGRGLQVASRATQESGGERNEAGGTDSKGTSGTTDTPGVGNSDRSNADPSNADRCNVDRSNVDLANTHRSNAHRSTSGQAKSAASPTSAAAAHAVHGRSLALIPIGIALALGVLWYFGTTDNRPSETAPATVGSATALSVLTASQDCASCHPSHTLEWERSVMAHSARSPLFNSLDMLIQEQVGRSFDCPNGAGALRRSDGVDVCRDPQTNLPITGSGGEHWCVNCHSPLERRLGSMQPWSASGFGDSRRRAPMPDQVTPQAMEGINCVFCHQVTGPAGLPGQDGYQGNPDWVSFVTGRRFQSRPEDREGRIGIANSGYYHDPTYMFDGRMHPDSPAKVHGVASESAKAYLKSSEFCGSCHDVRLFGTDMIGGTKGEHFKRLRNAYSEWRDWSEDQLRIGKPVASCQDCHMSLFPGICEPNQGGTTASADPLNDGCPDGTSFRAVLPGAQPDGGASTASDPNKPRTVHYFSGVDVPLTPSFDGAWKDDPTLDGAGLPIGLEDRRDLLLRNTVEMSLGENGINGTGVTFDGRTLQIPVFIKNVNAGHRFPAGFSQEREVWVHLRVTDANGQLIYEVGRVDDDAEDLRDKVFLRINTNPDIIDQNGAPIGLFGADVAEGPDHPVWQPPAETGATRFRGLGLINFQNGFLRCVTCIGQIGANGKCQPLFGQERTTAARFDDGEYDIDTGACGSNLVGTAAFFETWFPVGALDASRGAVKGPDAIIDHRSLGPNESRTYTYELNAAGFTRPFRVDATLNFRAFPPFLIRAFAEYEAAQVARGKRPSGALVTFDMLDKLEVVELEQTSLTIE